MSGGAKLYFFRSKQSTALKHCNDIHSCVKKKTDAIKHFWLNIMLRITGSRTRLSGREKHTILLMI